MSRSAPSHSPTGLGGESKMLQLLRKCSARNLNELTSSLQEMQAFNS